MRTRKFQVQIEGELVQGNTIRVKRGWIRRGILLMIELAIVVALIAILIFLLGL